MKTICIYLNVFLLIPDAVDRPLCNMRRFIPTYVCYLATTFLRRSPLHILTQMTALS
jgi:hypothetical protein